MTRFTGYYTLDNHNFSFLFSLGFFLTLVNVLLFIVFVQYVLFSPELLCCEDEAKDSEGWKEEIQLMAA